jgi:hypothetical protein
MKTMTNSGFGRYMKRHGETLRQRIEQQRKQRAAYAQSGFNHAVMAHAAAGFPRRLMLPAPVAA